MTSALAAAGLGMNEAELARNGVLTEFAVHDLNVDPRLPYEDNSFDVVTNAVSVDCAPAAHRDCTCTPAIPVLWEPPMLWAQCPLVIKQRPRVSIRWERGALHKAPGTAQESAATCSRPHVFPSAARRSVEAGGGVPGDAPGAEAGGQSHHELLQPLLPHKRCGAATVRHPRRAEPQRRSACRT